MFESKISPTTIPGFPSMVVLALTNVCTHQCVFCQYKNYSTRSDYELRHMDDKVYRKIVDEMSDYQEDTVLRLCAWGEPLLHPNIIGYVAYAASKNVKTCLLTNGYLLTPERSYELMKAGLNFTEVSIDAACRETYRKVRRSNILDAFNVVDNNVQRMVESRNKYDLLTKIVVSYVTWPTDKSEKEFGIFKEKWINITDDVVKRRLHSFSCAINPGWIKVPDDRLPCYGLWARAVINPWGKFVICYNQWEKDKWAIADLNDQDTSIADVWTGETLSKLRHGQVNGTFVGPCADCKDYNPTAWEHPFEEVLERVESKKTRHKQDDFR